MAISAGEVTALLSVRDNMSSAITQVTQRIQDLKEQMAELGNTSGPAFDALNAKLVSENVVLGDLKANLAGVNQSIAGVGSGFNAASGEMDQMDRIATRLVERLLVFYALKETFTFTVALFEGAAALEQMSTQTDLSVGKLQELQFAATETDTPFNKVSAAADTLNKKLAELAPTTVDALSDLHIGFDQLFALNPDERFDMIATAIGALPDHFQRTKYELALFGTDAIDPIIKRLEELEKAAHSTGAVMSDDNVKQLAMADKAFKELGETIKILAGNFITAEQNAVQFVTAPLFTDASLWQKFLTYATFVTNPGGAGAAYNKIMNISQGGGGVPTVPPPPATDPFANLPAATNAPLYGQAYVDNIREQSLAVKELTTEQEDEVRELQALDEWNAKNAAAIGLTSEQYKQITKDAQERSATENKIQADENKWNQEQAAALLEISKLWDQFNQVIGTGTGTAFDQQVDAIDRWALDLEARFQKAHADTDEFYTALAALWSAKLKQISVDTKALTDAATNDSKEGLQQIADKAYNTWQAALTHVGEWSDGTIQKFRDTYSAAQTAADNWGSDNAAWIDKLVADNQKLQASIDATAAKQQAAAGFFLTSAQLGFVNPFIPGSTGYLPGRASGGPVSAGQPYLVNENTPNSEIFIPSTSGYISPGSNMGSMAGGVMIAPTMVIQSLTPSDPKTIEYVRQAADRAIISSLRNIVRMGRA